MLKIVTLSLLVFSVSGAPSSQGNGDTSKPDPTIIAQFKEVVSTYISLPEQKNYEFFDKKDVKFNLYTREVPHAHEINLDNVESFFYNYSFNPKYETKVLIHDYLCDEQNMLEMVSAYIRDYDPQHKYVNVITVKYDSYSGAKYYDFLQLYPKIGEAVAEMINYLHSVGAHPDYMHLIGHGFGAHIAAAAASSLFPLKLGRITGLDPIGLDFESNSTLKQLTSSSADYVDVIYTNMKELGSNKERGVTRFYPNGGIVQTTGDDMYRNHYKSVHYFVESIFNHQAFQAHEANNYMEYLAGKRGQVEYMGEGSSRRHYGNYYLKTNAYPPYGLEGQEYQHQEQVQDQSFQSKRRREIKKKL